MITKQTLLGQMYVHHRNNGFRCVSADFHLVLTENGKVFQVSDPHTITLAPLIDSDAVLSANNASITKPDGMNWPEIPADGWAEFMRLRDLINTPENVAAALDAERQA